jgi:hypothetical protein
MAHNYPQPGDVFFTEGAEIEIIIKGASMPALMLDYIKLKTLSKLNFF